MPRPKAPPRLYLDPRRKQWVIRDGASYVRTGCSQSEIESAQAILGRYLAQKHKPQTGADPLIADILLTYATEHVPQTKSPQSAAYHIGSLAKWWQGKRLSDVTPANCRAYAAGRKVFGARRDLEVLRAAIRHANRYHGPLARVPSVILPDKAPPRQRWLTRDEAARLLRAARGLDHSHLRRFIILGLYTGSRSGDILALKWDQIDFKNGLLYRTPIGKAQDAKKRAPVVRLGKRILTHLRRWKRLDDPRIGYVCHYDGARVKKMRRSWRTARKRAGLDASVTPHTLRHTRATRLMQQGKNPHDVAGSLGMSPETLHRVYGHHHPDFQADVAETEA